MVKQLESLLALWELEDVKLWAPETTTFVSLIAGLFSP